MSKAIIKALRRADLGRALTWGRDGTEELLEDCSRNQRRKGASFARLIGSRATNVNGNYCANSKAPAIPGFAWRICGKVKPRCSCLEQQSAIRPAHTFHRILTKPEDPRHRGGGPVGGHLETSRAVPGGYRQTKSRASACGSCRSLALGAAGSVLGTSCTCRRFL